MSPPPELYTMPPLSPILRSPILTYAFPPTSPLVSSSAPLPASSSSSSQTAKIPRPANAFLLFRSDFLKSNQIPPDEECRQQTLSSVAGECWNMLSAEEKAVWRRKAAEVKHAHMARYPGYKYSPTRGTKASKKTKKSKPGDDVATRKKEERTRELREEFTSFKGEAVPSQRKARQLARSVRGTERATRSRKVPASTDSHPAAPNDLTSTSTSISLSTPSSSTTTSALFAPLPLLVPHGAFVPSSTHLTPAPSTGPQITRITQSPPLTPFHPSDRQPQLQRQLPEITLRNPSTAQWGLHQERAFGMGSNIGDISLSQGNVYPAMGGSSASAYFEPRGAGMHITMPVSDGNDSHSRSHSLDIGIGSMNMGMDNHLDLRVDYPTFSMDGTFMGHYRDAPETPYDLSDALCFSPAVSPSSPAWSSHPLTPSLYSSSQPLTPLTLTLTTPYYDYEPKFEQGSLALSESGRVDLRYLDATAGTSHTADGAHNHDHGAWSQELGAGGLEIEFGTMLHF